MACSACGRAAARRRVYPEQRGTTNPVSTKADMGSDQSGKDVPREGQPTAPATGAPAQGGTQSFALLMPDGSRPVQGVSRLEAQAARVRFGGTGRVVSM